MGIWADIKNRRITQFVLPYLAGGWVALEVVSSLIERGILPGIVYPIGLVFFLAGVPASLILAWNHGERGEQKTTPLEIILLSIVAVGAVSASAFVFQRHRAQERLAVAQLESTLDLHRVAVLYFDDLSRDSSLAPVADGLTEDLMDRLSAVGALDVVSRNGVLHFRDSPLPLDSIATELKAGTVITGSVEPARTGVRVTVRLLDGESGSEIKRNTLEVAAPEILSARDQVADEVARDLREWLGEEIRMRERRAETTDLAAWTLFQRAEKAYKDADAALRQENAPAAWRDYLAADSIAASAAELDTSWVEPVLLRSRVTYERSWLADSPQEAAAILDTVLVRADESLSLSRNEPRALELRGTAHYRLWLLHTEPDPDRAAALLKSAREDLEAAVQADPGLASAYSTLSHLYYQVDDVPGAVLAARRAYEEDAYLRAADGILWRLYSASYDLEQSTQAQRWCAEGGRRFPDDFRFVECRLWLMTMPGITPDVDEAWRLLARMDNLTAGPEGELRRREARLVVGGIIGRAGLPDSADHVLLTGRAGPELDPDQELLSIEAAMRALFGEKTEAVSLLKRYVLANPGHFSEGSGLHWWWRGLQDQPDFQEIRGLQR